MDRKAPEPTNSYDAACDGDFRAKWFTRLLDERVPFEDEMCETPFVGPRTTLHMCNQLRPTQHLDSHRVRVRVQGQVQGVGFRPYVARLAAEHHLGGFVGNDAAGVFVEVEGSEQALAQFLGELPSRLPPLARIDELHTRPIPATGVKTFHIVASDRGARPSTLVPPDAATCDECLRELLDPTDRRYGYPFINCTNCGPRYSIVLSIPYDRPQTTMRDFEMCPACRREYESATDRRYHAQPNACPSCGPSLQLVRPDGSPIGATDSAIRDTARLLQSGSIVAVKGIGGFHLACSALDETAVRRLRERKSRESKPFAVMVGELDVARQLARIDDVARQVLTSAARPIVLLPKREPSKLAPSVAPGLDTIGLMLPYAPVHTLLFSEGLGPLVMTSGNASGEPLCYENDDAVQRLGAIVDALLLHDRPIARPIDDSVCQWVAGVGQRSSHTMMVRRARGYVPLPTSLLPKQTRHAVDSPQAYDTPILAVGADLKNTVCVVRRHEAVVSEHLGDLDNARAYRHFKAAVDRLLQLTAVDPLVVACDLHPGYHSGRFARRIASNHDAVIEVQHHHAHVVSCMVDNGLADEPVIGLACDGTGYGPDGTIWGCELLVADRRGFDRLGRLMPFPLVGADQAARQTWRSAVSLTSLSFPHQWQERWRRAELPRPAHFDLVASALDTPRKPRAATVMTSSAGRLFDGVASLLDLCQLNRHEAQAPVALQTAAERCAKQGRSTDVSTWPIVSANDGMWELDWRPFVREWFEARGRERTSNELLQQSWSLRFHQGFADGLARLALKASRTTGLRNVVLSGGVFHNTLLLGLLVERLTSMGLTAFSHRSVPCGDGGISLGQAAVAAARMASSNDVRMPDNNERT